MTLDLNEFCDWIGENVGVMHEARLRKLIRENNVIEYRKGQMDKQDELRLADRRKGGTSCACGHSRSAHIYEDGACRPGFVCSCGGYNAVELERRYGK